MVKRSVYIRCPCGYTKSRRDQKEGGELDSHEEAKPGRDQEQGGGAGL